DEAEGGEDGRLGPQGKGFRRTPFRSAIAEVDARASGRPRARRDTTDAGAPLSTSSLSVLANGVLGSCLPTQIATHTHPLPRLIDGIVGPDEHAACFRSRGSDSTRSPPIGGTISRSFLASAGPAGGAGACGG